MPHPQETNFTDLPAGFSNLWFVDVTSVMPVKGPLRPEYQIRKLLIHHHAGFTHDLRPKSKTQPTIPQQYISYGTGTFATQQYGYHYDLPFIEEIISNKRVVYITSEIGRHHYHTGGGQNEWGIGISLVGTARGVSEYPDARFFGSKHTTPEEYRTSRGLPSENQRKILPVLVRWLQERHNIADAHVQAHFQWGKPSCPGYDTERWVMHHEDRQRREGKAFCYPVALTKADSGKPQFLKEPAQERTRAAEYIKNTVKGRSGFFPFGRRHFWHNGVHLFPEGGVGTPVHAVRDGWVVAARFDKEVKVKSADGTEVDYGSANFVIVQHEDPGLVDKKDKRTSADEVFSINQAGTKQWLGVPVCPHYYSLYMHLQKLDDGIAWVKKLKDSDPKLFEKIGKKPGEVYDFTTGSKVALPVKTGEIIGKVGAYDPFAARPADLKVKHPEIFDAKFRCLLHFEMFSGHNLLERLDPDKNVHKFWLIDDTDADAFSKSAAEKLDKVPGLQAIAPVFNEALKKIEEADPRHQDPSLFSELMDTAATNNLTALSQVVVHHVSEWQADWKSVIEGWFREWGLTKGKPDKDQKAGAEHAVKVAKEFGFKWKFPDMSYRRPALSALPYFYHPIRLLCWLNGLVRTPDHDLPFNDAGATAYDISARTVRVAKGAAQGDDALFLDKASAQGMAKFSATPLVGKDDADQAKYVRVIFDLENLKGSRFRLPDSETIYTISSTSAEKEGQKIKFSPVLEAKIDKGKQIRFGLYGWHWEKKFDWNNSIV